MARGKRGAVDARAMKMLTQLEAAGDQGMDRDEIMGVLACDFPTFRVALERARLLAAEMDLAITRPIARDGWRYRLTGSWLGGGVDPDLAEGTILRLRDELTRALSSVRDSEVALTNADRRTVQGRMLARMVPIVAGAAASIEMALEAIGT